VTLRSRLGVRGDGARHAIRGRQVLAGATHAGRVHWKPVLAVAVVVFGISALAETASDARVADSAVGVAVPVGVLAFAVDLFGEVFFTGLLERLVGQARYGATEQGVLTVLRTLPYRRLILADVLVTVLVALGYLALIVPGLVLFTLLCLTAPIVNIEGQSAVRAMRRSVQLVRGRFWLTLILVTVPFTIADWIGTAVQDAVHGEPLWIDFAVRLAVMIVVAVCTGLVQVELAYRFIEADVEDNRPATS
jgi:hypothetical protein